jgi:hypothetical protein
LGVLQRVRCRFFPVNEYREFKKEELIAFLPARQTTSNANGSSPCSLMFECRQTFAHRLHRRSELIDLRLLCGDGLAQLQGLAMLLLRFVQQDRRQELIHHRVDLAVAVPHHQVRIHLRHLLGDQPLGMTGAIRFLH